MFECKLIIKKLFFQREMAKLVEVLTSLTSGETMVTVAKISVNGIRSLIEINMPALLDTLKEES